jgi:phosphate:Na+ symporter
MNFTSLSTAAGGLALFLFAMLLMTEGLKAFGGSGLKRLLGQWTSSPARGVAAGFLVTALVQSSSAVTVATIGFVNAGVLTLRQALGVIFGTNVGTTMTGWLVSLVGFGFKIESFALPLLALGVALRLTAAGKRAQGLGDALAGFGLFFLGLALLKDAFAGLAASYGAGAAAGLAGGWPAALAVGFVATVLTQSSSAAIAIILTAASGGMASLADAAAAVIGANLGTTSTAAFAALKATAAARRLALGHIAFNLITGVVAVALLPALLVAVRQLADVLDLERNPAIVLALFHTVFNVFGVVLLLPLSSRLAAGLERLFRSTEDDLARPQHLDRPSPPPPSWPWAQCAPNWTGWPGPRAPRRQRRSERSRPRCRPGPTPRAGWPRRSQSSSAACARRRCRATLPTASPQRCARRATSMKWRAWRPWPGACAARWQRRHWPQSTRLARRSPWQRTASRRRPKPTARQRQRRLPSRTPITRARLRC